MSTSQNRVDPSHPSDAAMLREQAGNPSTGSYLSPQELASMSQLDPANLVAELANSREVVAADNPVRQMSTDQLRDAMQQSMKAIQDFRSVRQSVDRLESRAANSNDVTGLIGFPAIDSQGNAILDQTGSEYEKAQRAADESRRSAARAGLGDHEYDWAIQQLESTNPNAPPPQPDIAAIQENADGTLEVRLQTGEVFKGDPRKVIGAMSQSYVHGKRWAQGLKQQLKEQQAGQANVQQPTQPTNVPTMQQPDPNQPGWDALGQLPNESSKWILDNMVAKPLGFSDSAELVGAWQGMQQKIAEQDQALEDYRNDRTAQSFLASHPEFPGDDRSADILLDVLDRSGLPYTAGNLELAHTLALSKGVYRALTPTEIRVANGEAPQTSGRQVPPPPPPGNSPDSYDTIGNPWAQSTDELRKRVLQQGGMGRLLMELKPGSALGE